MKRYTVNVYDHRTGVQRIEHQKSFETLEEALQRAFSITNPTYSVRIETESNNAGGNLFYYDDNLVLNSNTLKRIAGIRNLSFVPRKCKGQLLTTKLPLFKGFYGSILEYDREEQDIEYYNEENGTDFNYDNFEWDYKSYHKEVAEWCTLEVGTELKKAGLIRDFEFIKISLPREYNFHNDEIEIKVTLFQSNRKEIRKLLDKHSKQFDEFIKEKCTSRDGFSSFYSNDYRVWYDEFVRGGFSNDYVQYGLILEFCASMIYEDDFEENAYEYATGNISCDFEVIK